MPNHLQWSHRPLSRCTFLCPSKTNIRTEDRKNTRRNPSGTRMMPGCQLRRRRQFVDPILVTSKMLLGGRWVLIWSLWGSLAHIRGVSWSPNVKNTINATVFHCFEGFHFFAFGRLRASLWKLWATIWAVWGCRWPVLGSSGVPLDDLGLPHGPSSHRKVDKKWTCVAQGRPGGSQTADTRKTTIGSVAKMGSRLSESHMFRVAGAQLLDRFGGGHGPSRTLLGLRFG